MIQNPGPWVVLLVLLFIILLMWLFWPRELLQHNTEDIIIDKPSIKENIIETKYTLKDEVCYNNMTDIVAKTPAPQLLADLSKTLEFNTADLRTKLHSRIANQMQNIITTPNSRQSGKKFVSRGEQICRLTIETIYQVPFPNQRPNILKNPETGENLELDCYNADLKLAVEYNGKQHYFYDGDGKDVFHKSVEDFCRTVRRDDLKRRLCQQHGITLIIVPYTIENKDIPNFIVTYLPESIRQRHDTMYVIAQLSQQFNNV